MKWVRKEAARASPASTSYSRERPVSGVAEGLFLSALRKSAGSRYLVGRGRSAGKGETKLLGWVLRVSRPGELPKYLLLTQDGFFLGDRATREDIQEVEARIKEFEVWLRE